ncbi:hypothetical protein DL767_008061 [Monosporascus sp. MG133]|nr:hypothetical protein DL767_008061 [Monosporascus sp. MG133]
MFCSTYSQDILWVNGPKSAAGRTSRVSRPGRLHAQAEGLHDVGARADAGVEEDSHQVPDGVQDLQERLQRANGAVHLPAAVVAHHYALHAVLEGRPGIADALDPLEHDGAVPVPPQELEAAPGVAVSPEKASLSQYRDAATTLSSGLSPSDRSANLRRKTGLLKAAARARLSSEAVISSFTGQ